LSKKPDHLTGDIILLPRISGIDNRKAVSLVLQEITGLHQQTLPPEWADKLIVPGVTDLIAQIDGKLQQTRALETEISLLNQNVDTLNEYKRLLYATVSELANVVERCFKELGGQVIQAKYSEEDFVLIYGGTEYLVEVKGASKSIALSHLRQLNSYLLKYEEDKDQSCKGILFGNAWCTLPPHDRGEPEHPVFPDNVKKRAEQYDVALVSSIDFYQAFMGFLEHCQGGSILDAVTTQKGTVKFS
jgi:hypothetical protein